MKHNKRRNVGLVYEFLARHAAEGIVEGDEVQSMLDKNNTQGLIAPLPLAIAHHLIRACLTF